MSKSPYKIMKASLFVFGLALSLGLPIHSAGESTTPTKSATTPSAPAATPSNEGNKTDTPPLPPKEPNEAKVINTHISHNSTHESSDQASQAHEKNSDSPKDDLIIHNAAGQNEEVDLEFSEASDVQQTPLAPTKPLKIQATHKIEILSRGTEVINLPQAAAQVLVTDPKIADVQLATPNTLYIYGRLPGTTEVMVTGNDLESAYRYDVIVKSDITELQKVIRLMSPTADVKAIPLPDGVMLQGLVDSPKASEDIRQVAQRYVGQTGNVVNMIKAKNAIQISLRVKIAEVRRSIIQKLGVNWGTQSYNKHFRFGVMRGSGPITNVASNNTGFLADPKGLGQFVPPGTADDFSRLGLRFTDAIHDFAALIDALSKEDLATILAEPNLVTVSGEEASFLAGGEFPYPVVQGIGAAATVTVQYKPYGISLSFIPTMIGDTIHLRVRPEVSAIDLSLQSQGAPALTTRRAEATLQIGNGETMVMAGLLSSNDTKAINALPGLRELPIIGALFGSNDFQTDKTELIISVTPYIVKPIDNPKDVILPTQGLKYTRLLDQVLQRRLNEPTPALRSGQKPVLVGEAGFNF